MSARPSALGRWWPAAGLLLALLATVGVYAAGLRGPFLMDDYDAIFPLAAAQSSGLSWDEVLRSAPGHIRERWLANLSFVLSHGLAGASMPPSPLAFKLGNLLVHLACGLALFALARKLATHWGEARRAHWIALAAAAVFLLHPLLVSTVLYPVQRMAQLSTLFLLLAVHAYLRWRERIDALSTPGHVIAIAQVAGFALLAFLCKENGALAPLLLLAVELTALRWPARGSAARGPFEAGFGVLVGAPLVLGMLALVLRWERILAGYARRDYTFAERVLTEPHVLLDYLGQIVWPRIGSMGLMRDDFPVRTAIDAPTVAVFVGFALAIGAALVLRRRQPPLALAVLWFFAAHALESTVIGIELVFEHRNYLALFGPALALAWYATRLPPRIAVAVAALGIGALGVQTARRVADWADYGRWIATEATQHPQSLRAGTELMLFRAANGDADGAQRELARLHAAHPGHAQPRLLKLAFACRDDSEVPALDAEDLAALARDEVGKDAFHVYAGVRDRVLARCATRTDWSAFADASAAVAANPHTATTRRAHAAWLRLHAEARQQLADWTGVRQALGRVVELDPSDPRDWLLLAEAAVHTGDQATYVQARQGFLRLMQGRPGALARELARIDASAATAWSGASSR